MAIRTEWFLRISRIDEIFINRFICGALRHLLPGLNSPQISGGGYSLQKVHLRQWPDAAGSQSPSSSDHRLQHLKLCMLQKRAASQYWLCEPVWTPDVQWKQKLKKRLLQTSGSPWGLNLNGTTNVDRTNLFQKFSVKALDMVLSAGKRPHGVYALGDSPP